MSLRSRIARAIASANLRSTLAVNRVARRTLPFFAKLTDKDPGFIEMMNRLLDSQVEAATNISPLNASWLAGEITFAEYCERGAAVSEKAYGRHLGWRTDAPQQRAEMDVIELTRIAFDLYNVRSEASGLLENLTEEEVAFVEDAVDRIADRIELNDEDVLQQVLESVMS